jgi:methionine sulfoxide reductase heme-binding subunit
MDHALWYASRGTGLVCLLLLSTSVVLGLLGAGRFSSTAWPRFVVAALHRNVSLLIVVFLLVHIATAVVDPYAGIGWLAAVVPFTSSYQPLWLGLGAVALDLLVALIVTSLLRTRINARLWRVVHACAYACWPLAVVHGFAIGGIDRMKPWVLALDAVSVLAVLLALGYRIVASHPDTEARAAGLSGLPARGRP